MGGENGLSKPYVRSGCWYWCPGEECRLPIDLTVKHPLGETWTLWLLENNPVKTWEENLREVSSFSTAEDFWCLINFIVPPSELAEGCEYSVFKKGIAPKWEDEQNSSGGRWMVSLPKRRRVDQLDELWLETLLCLIGDGFQENRDQVSGAVVSVKARGDRIAVWSSADSQNIGEALTNALRVVGNFSVRYQSHRENIAKSNTS